MTKSLLTITLVISCIISYGQATADLIVMKSGAIYQGTVSEYVPNTQAVIKLIDGKVVTLACDDMESLTIAGRKVIKLQIDQKQKGYYMNLYAGPQFGKSPRGALEPYLSLTMVNGYRLKNHHFGGGVGLENHASKWYAPLSIDYTYHFSNGQFSPLAGVNGGFMIPLNQVTDREFNYDRGAFIGGKIGIASFSTKHVAFLLHLTYRYIHLEGAEYTTFNPWGESSVVQGSADLHRIGIMIGIAIN